MEEFKTKKELIIEAQILADKFDAKKLVIETAINILDSKRKVGQEHITGMAIIEDMFRELDQIEDEQKVILDKIKKS